MLSMLVLDTLNFDEINVSDMLKNAYTQRELPIKRLSIVHNLQSLQKNRKDHIECCNVFVISLGKVTEEYIEFTQAIRRERINIFIVFILDRKADITACVRPSIRPSGIMFIPLEKHRVFKTISEIYIEYLRLREKEEQPIFTIKSNSEYFYINTGEIFFFEAQGKKIAVKTKGQEIAFYSNFDTILEQLPDWFFRCHKGFVVNTRQIAQSNFTEMTLTLKDKCVLPISRTYRDEIKTFLNF